MTKHFASGTRWPASCKKFVSAVLSEDWEEYQSAWDLAHASTEELQRLFGRNYNLAELNRASAFAQAESASLRIAFWSLLVDGAKLREIQMAHARVLECDERACALIELVAESGVIKTEQFQTILAQMGKRSKQRVNFVNSKIKTRLL